MNTETKKKNSIFLEVMHFISTIISWTVFVLLVICAMLLIYYFIATQIYARKGEKYAPPFSLYTIISGSMTPNINKYDVIIDTKPKSPESIKIGDVITFISTSTEHMNATVTHRVISIIIDEEGNYSYQTKGDYNLVEDSSSVPFNNIIGVVALRIPQLGKIQAFIASSYGWMFLLLIVALYILLKGLLNRLKEKYPELGKGPIWQTKFGKIMTRPLLGGERRKLLPPPEDPIEIEENYPIFTVEPAEFSINESIHIEPPIEKEPTINPSLFDNFDNTVSEERTENITPIIIEEPAIEAESEVTPTIEFGEDVNFDDLPELK